MVKAQKSTKKLENAKKEKSHGDFLFQPSGNLNSTSGLQHSQQPVKRN
jgi:hypothetical protein